MSFRIESELRNVGIPSFGRHIRSEFFTRLADGTLFDSATPCSGTTPTHEEYVADSPTDLLRDILSCCVNCRCPNLNEALTVSDELIRRGEMSELDHVHRGYALRKVERWADSLDELNTALEINPNRAVSWAIRAFVHYKLSLLAKGISDATRAIELDPGLARAYRYRAICLSAKDEHESAIVDATKAIELDPNTDANYAVRGGDYYLTYKYDLALADFDKSIQLNPRTASSFGYRARVYFINGRHESALKDLDHRIDVLGSLVPAMDIHHYLRALCLCLVRQDYPAALRDLMKSFEMNPEWGELEIRLRQITPELSVRIVASFIPKLLQCASTRKERRVVKSFKQHILSIRPKYLSRVCANEGCCRIRDVDDTEEMKKCSRCHRVYYCSRECQVAHWPSHQEVCCPAGVRRNKNQNRRRRRAKRNRGGGKKPSARVMKRLRREARRRR